ncbi:MAG: DUF5677 domain-containing protein [Novosphingobium sp.]
MRFTRIWLVGIVQGLMNELRHITDKYQPDFIGEGLASLEGLNRFSYVFYSDVAEIYDCLTRVKNVERNPSGFTLDDAPILGLLVRIVKLMKELREYYGRDNAEIISILERPLIEASVIATYLLRHGPEIMLDYRKCSYKDRLRILRDFDAGSLFANTKPGQRLLKSVYEKLDAEGFTKDDFAEQKKNRWRLQGKTFYDIFDEIEHKNLYASTYGMMSESIHGSWNESLDWCLTKKPDGTYNPNLFSYPADVRFMALTVKFANPPFRLWLNQIDALDDSMRGVLDWIENVNTTLFFRFDALFGE